MQKPILFIITIIFILSFCFTVVAESELTDVQRNSITMMNYLLTVTKEINDSKESRIFLENTYDSLINNTHPNAVDSDTQSQLNMMLDTLEHYRMLSEKRKRLAFLYEQNQAQTIKSAIPNPLGLISVAESDNLLKSIASIAYMAVDSIASYKSYKQENELKYLQSGWELDDEEAAELHTSRKMAFNYMIDMVQMYDLPGDLALSEKAIDDFIAEKNNDNVFRRIHFLESEQKTYEGFAYYWLLLGESYYEAGDYENCVKATDKYLSLNNRIFRYDYDLAKELPMAINAAREIYDGKEYEKVAIRYAEAIIDNAGSGNWELRYFAAQTYVDLYLQTGNTDYLQMAYDTTLDNIVYLIPTQKGLNETYLAPVQKVDVPKNASKSEKEEINQYNKMLEEVRKKELPPIYEPLIINCDLLFQLMDSINASEEERLRVDRILHGNSGLFLAEPLNDLYSYQRVPKEYDKVNFEKWDADRLDDNKSSVLTLPVSVLTSSSIITVCVDEQSPGTLFGVFEYADWYIDKLVRETEGDINTFYVICKSPTMKTRNYGDATIYIHVVSADGFEGKANFKFKVKDWDTGFFKGENVEFYRVE